MATRRRMRRQAAGLEVTAFINLIVVLVPFLLSTAVFSRMAVHDLSLPARAADAQLMQADELQLEIVIRREHIDVADRIGGLIERLPKVKANGVANAGAQHDVQRLGALMHDLKQRYPQKTSATVLAESETPYEQLIQVMDAVRSKVDLQGSRLQRTPLFPDIAVGDAPVERRP